MTSSSRTSAQKCVAIFTIGYHMCTVYGHTFRKDSSVAALTSSSNDVVPTVTNAVFGRESADITRDVYKPSWAWWWWWSCCTAQYSITHVHCTFEFIQVWAERVVWLPYFTTYPHDCWLDYIYIHTAWELELNRKFSSVYFSKLLN